MPAVPTNLQPVHGSTVTTSNFGVACALGVSPILQQAQWQVSSNFSFTGTPRTITSELKTPGSLSMLVGLPRIPQGTWYVRVRAIDEAGVPSAWSSVNTFAIFHPSTGLTRTPADGASVVWAGGVMTFSWDFFDTSSLDTQTAYKIAVSVSPEDATYSNISLLYLSYTALRSSNLTYDDLKAPPALNTLFDTGKVFNVAARTATVTLPVSAKNRPSRWTIQTWDNDDASAGPSAGSLMFLGDLPAITITAPIGSVSVAAPTIQWSYNSPSGSPQASFQVVIRDAITGEVLHSSPTINTATQSYTSSSPVFQNQRQATITVTVNSANGMQTSTTSTVLPQWITPPSPSFTIDRGFYDTAGFVDIDWSDAISAPAFISWKVYRRTGLYESWEIIGTTQEKFFRDFTAPPIAGIEYAVTQTATVLGEVVESSLIPQSIDLISSIYLLTVEGNEGIAIRLHNVVSDDFTKEYESNIMNIVGVGRKAEVGSTWGMIGTLALQLRDSAGAGTQGLASDQWKMLEEIKDQRKVCVLRIPFGRTFRVHIGDLSASRIAGVTSEIMDVSFDYTEVR